jgi:hypothetical protein
MKKFKTILTALVMLFAVSAFATDPGAGPVKVTPKVKAAFENDFSKASQAYWDKTDEFYFVSFVLNDVQVDAAYNEEGKLVGTSRSVSLEQLPLNVSLALSEKYQGYHLQKMAVEITYEGVTSYYVTAENKDLVLKLKCHSTGDIDVDQKFKKTKS